MDFRDRLPMDILDEARDLSGQNLTKFIDIVNDEFNYATKKKEPPHITLYYRDLLSYLIKTYGH